MRVTLERMFTLIYSMQYRISLGLGPCMSKNPCGVIDYRRPSCAQGVTVQGCNSRAVFSGSMPLHSWDLGEAPVHLAFPKELATYPRAPKVPGRSGCVVSLGCEAGVEGELQVAEGGVFLWFCVFFSFGSAGVNRVNFE